MKTWTIMIYMAGDNNLSEDMITGLIGLRQATVDKSKIAVTAFYDSNAIGVPTRRFDITNGTTIELDESAISVDSITKFIEWSVREQGHEAENYALILSGHGEGYQRETFLSDLNPRASVSVTELGKGLHRITKNPANPADFHLGKSLSIIGFDSCVMSTVEVSAEIADTTDFIVGSQGFVANSGWDYRAIANRISAPDADLSPLAVARLLADCFIDHNKPYIEHGGRSADVSITDVGSGSRFQSIVDGVNQLGSDLRDGFENESSSRILEQLILNSHYRCQTLIVDQAIDILDFCAILNAECSSAIAENDAVIGLAPNSDAAAIAGDANLRLKKVAETAKSLAEAVSDCCEFRYVGPEYQWAGGLSLYFPWSFRSYQLTRSAYSEYRIFDGDSEAAGGWLAFLDLYLEATMRPVRGVGPSKEIEPEYLDGEMSGRRWLPPNLRWAPPNLRWAPPNFKFAADAGKWAIGSSRWSPSEESVKTQNKWDGTVTRMDDAERPGGSELSRLYDHGPGSKPMETFSRFKNVPWFPGDWWAEE